MFIAVHSSDVNPSTYSIATLKGHGLREESVIRCFANLVRRRLPQALGSQVRYTPPSVDDFLIDLESFGPVKCIFNAISPSINPKRPMGNDGYIKATNSSESEKIATIAECWERLITNRRTPTATARSLALHRVTGSTEATQILKKCGFGISEMLPKGFTKKKSVHVTFDNSDGKQQTLLGYNTTHHHTNGTIFQLSNPAVETIDASCERQVDLEEENEESTSNFSTFRIPPKRNRKLPPPFPEFSDECKRSDLLVLWFPYVTCIS